MHFVCATSIFFINGVIMERKIPSDIAADENQEWSDKAVENFESMRQTLADAGIQDLSLEEINEIIKEVRNQPK